MGAQIIKVGLQQAVEAGGKLIQHTLLGCASEFGRIADQGTVRYKEVACPVAVRQFGDCTDNIINSIANNKVIAVWRRNVGAWIAGVGPWQAIWR